MATLTPETAQASCEWSVSGMDCGACASKIKDAVARLPGVSDVSVTLMAERLRLTLDEAQTPRDKVEATVKSLSYGIAPKGEAPARKGFVMPQHGAHGNETVVNTGPDTGHGSAGHVHDGPADGGKRWYETAKGRLVIFTGLLLGVA
jgi:Cd2+/Zn2+-exporting ATPase